MAVPAAINTREDPSASATNNKPSPSSPTTATPTAQRQAPPEVVLTPATPSTPLHTSNKVDQPLPVPEEKGKDAAAAGSSKQAGSGGPVESLTRKLSGSGRSKTPDKKNTTSTTPAASSSRPKTAASAPKKKKRSGFNNFLLRFGCLSADELEDPEPRKGGASTSGGAKTTTPGSSASTPAQTKTGDSKPTTATAAPASAPKEVKQPATTTSATAPKEKEQSGVQPAVAAGAAAAGAGVGAATAAAVGDKEKSATADSAAGSSDGVVVAPHEPATLPDDETAGLTSSAVQAPGSGSALLSTPVRPSSSRRQSESSPTSAEEERTETSGGYSNISESEIPDESSGAAGAAVYNEEYGLEDEYEDDEDRLIAQGGIGIPVDENGQPAPLLRPMDPDHSGRKCLVLDLDETLLHSSFRMLPSADYIVPVEIESQTHNVYVIKRPGVDHFLTEMGKIYEVVIFTASLSKYADPVLDMLDPGRVVRHRLFRESCYNHKGNYVKDLSQLGRDMEGCIIIDNSPASYIFHPNNAVPVSTWFNDPHDTELTDLCPFLADLATVDDIRGVLDGSI